MSVIAVDFAAAARERTLERWAAMRRHPAGRLLNSTPAAHPSTGALADGGDAERGTAAGTGKSDVVPLDASRGGGAA